MQADQSPSSLGPWVVGQRVVVRRVVPGETGPSGGPAMTDVLGECLSWTDRVVTVRRENGEVVPIPREQIVAGKPVPPRPSVRRRLDPVEADRRVVAGWRPVESEPLGEWLLRASGGFSSRANSVLALGDPGMPPEEAVTHVTRWYADRSLEARAHVHPGSAAAEAFTAAGWSAYEQTYLLLAGVARALRRTAGAGSGATLSPVLDDGWLATDERAARFGDPARAVLEAGEVTFATVREEGEVVARGRGSRHGDWLGVSSLWTHPDRRGRGLGTGVLRSLLEWGAEQGATTAYLQVVVANESAQELYGRAGFEVHHRYDYLSGGPHRTVSPAM